MLFFTVCTASRLGVSHLSRFRDKLRAFDFRAAANISRRKQFQQWFAAANIHLFER